MIFKDPKALLSLYNAVNGTNYTDPGDLRVVTLENAIYMNMKNDLAFIIDGNLNLYEHQSSVNMNMPLRDLIYIAEEYQGMVSNNCMYVPRLVKLPTPFFVVFYNGTAKQPEKLEMKLSDAFEVKTKEPALELKVIQLNIGKGYNTELKAKCPLLEQYATYVSRVQENGNHMPLKDAVEKAVNDCIKDGILAEFLRKNRGEAIGMSIYEYDEEKVKALIAEAERENGAEESKVEDLRNLMNTLGCTLDQAMDYLCIEQKDREKYRDETLGTGIYELDQEKLKMFKAAAERENGAEEKQAEDIQKIMKKLDYTIDQAMDLLDIEQKERKKYLEMVMKKTEE